MKKVSLILSMTIVLTLLGLGTANATVYDYGTDSLVIGGTNSLVLRTSKFVYVMYTVFEQNGVGVAYAYGSYHNAGNRTFGSGSVDSKLYYQEATAGSVTISEPTDASTSTFTGSWQPL